MYVCTYVCMTVSTTVSAMLWRSRGQVPCMERFLSSSVWPPLPLLSAQGMYVCMYVCICICVCKCVCMYVCMLGHFTYAVHHTSG